MYFSRFQISKLQLLTKPFQNACFCLPKLLFFASFRRRINKGVSHFAARLCVWELSAIPYYLLSFLSIRTLNQKPPITERARKLTHTGFSVSNQSLMGTREVVSL